MGRIRVDVICTSLYDRLRYLVQEDVFLNVVGDLLVLQDIDCHLVSSDLNTYGVAVKAS